MENLLSRWRIHWDHEPDLWRSTSVVRQGPQPRWGWISLARCSQGSSFLATLGFEMESLWDSPNGWFMESFLSRWRIYWRHELAKPPVY